jgi:spore maturation protein CgeB
MKFVLFYPSLVSDWNNGNAHFLRGVATELLARNHVVRVFEPAGGWSLQNLTTDHGETPVHDFFAAYPRLTSQFYDPAALDLDRALDGADIVIVHEWNEPELVRRIGRHRDLSSGYKLLFHDTHHRAATESASIERLGLAAYDGVLAFGAVIRDIYLKRGWSTRAWIWHEAADTRLFKPWREEGDDSADGDLVWVGNWGDGERTRELDEFLLEPARRLHLRTKVYGVRYPETAKQALRKAGIAYGGWLANFRVPQMFSRYKATIHVPRRAYRREVRGVPTIRVFEALACGIPLVCAPWDDSEGLFQAGRDYLTAADGAAMEHCLAELVNDRQMARTLAAHGRETLLGRHTCAHRVDELLEICAQLGIDQGRLTRSSQPAKILSRHPYDQEGAPSALHAGQVLELAAGVRRN